ncbi:MAG TPA: aspartyl protease family protein [Steroidobacteraceae bacterium]|nr:aspartyl protease family protein [Steroidobacteraceae bacterium]
MALAAGRRYRPCRAGIAAASLTMLLGSALPAAAAGRIINPPSSTALPSGPLPAAPTPSPGGPADSGTADPTAHPAVPEVAVEAPEPRYVAPTLRDRIGRIWAPVLINGKGPYRLVLDTGANRSAVTAAVAASLGIAVDPSAQVLLRGVTGSASVPTIHVNNMLVGELMIESPTLPIVPDALGGAQGVLGTEGLGDKRILIDFLHDRITIRRAGSHWREGGYVDVPIQLTSERLLTTRARVGGIWAKAIIDTGAQSSVANSALLEALQRRHHYRLTPDEVVGTTDDVQPGQDAAVPAIQLGDISIEGARLTMGDLRIFEAWKLTKEPAILIGMDTLGLVESIIIDYKHRALMIRPRATLHGPFDDEYDPWGFRH